MDNLKKDIKHFEAEKNCFLIEIDELPDENERMVSKLNEIIK